MKPVADSYSARIHYTHVPALGERLVALVPTIPSYVWLAMILLAASLLGVTTMARARGQWQKAQSAHQATASRLQQAKTANAELKARTNLLRQNSRAAAQAAQEQLHHVRPNEIVIATR